MWRRFITYNSFENTRGISRITSGAESEVVGGENGEENDKVGETKYLRESLVGGGQERRVPRGLSMLSRVKTGQAQARDHKKRVRYDFVTLTWV